MSRLLRTGYLLLTLVVLLGASAGVQTSYAAKNDPEIARLELDDVALKVRFRDEIGAEARRAILEWIKQSARAVLLYYGRFPVPELDIYIDPVPGRGVKSGRAFGGQTPRLFVSVGVGSTQADYQRDWIMVHEMIHMAFPMMDDRHDWMVEGLAVYVESVARLQAGDLSEAEVWKGFVDGMKNGVPRSGDKGLDHTPTWGRTYWGGTIFLLYADLEIRKQTSGKRTLKDAVRAILAAGGDHRTHWPLRKALKVGDEATGTTVLTDLYEAWRATPVDPELNQLWKRMGVRDTGKTVSFDDTAPLAAVRRQIGTRSTP